MRGVEITSEQTVGDVAEVVARVTYGNGGIAVVRYRLLRTHGTWVVDDGRDEPQVVEQNRVSRRCDFDERVTRAAMMVAVLPLPFVAAPGTAASEIRQPETKSQLCTITGNIE